VYQAVAIALGQPFGQHHMGNQRTYRRASHHIGPKFVHWVNDPVRSDLKMSVSRCTCIGYLEPHVLTGLPSWRSILPDPECPCVRHRRSAPEATDTPAPA
jgi:hypothetical protein